LSVAIEAYAFALGPPADIGLIAISPHMQPVSRYPHPYRRRPHRRFPPPAVSMITTTPSHPTCLSRLHQSATPWPTIPPKLSFPPFLWHWWDPTRNPKFGRMRDPTRTHKPKISSSPLPTLPRPGARLRLR
jgi:hypothetical protein